MGTNNYSQYYYRVNSMQRFKNILLVFSGSNLSDPATQRAMTLARTNQARLTVVDIVNTSFLRRQFPVFSEKISAIHQQICEDRRGEMTKLFHDFSQDTSVSIEVLNGKPFLQIIQYVLEHGCDLVIKSLVQEKHFSTILFGSTDLRLLRKCPCPVWIVKPDDHMQTRKILAAVELEAFEDDSELEQLNRQIVEIAASLAYRESGELNIVNAWIVFGEKLLKNKLSKLYEDDVDSWMIEQKRNIESDQGKFVKVFKNHLAREKMEGLNYSFHFIEGEAEDVIVDLAKKNKIDLVVMGTVGRTDLAGFFVGNTSEAILNQINCSVLAVKPSGFVSPVTIGNK